MSEWTLLAPTAEQRHAQVQRDLDARIELMRQRDAKQERLARRACEQATVQFTIHGDARFVHRMHWFVVVTEHQAASGHAYLAQSVQVALDEAHALTRHRQSLQRSPNRLPRAYRETTHMVADMKGGAR